jgi:hypothetical protein
MRRIFLVDKNPVKRFLFSFTILASLLTTACQKKEWKQPGETWKAEAILSSTTDKVFHTFNTENLSGHHIKILGYTNSCGCTSVTLSKRDLNPGEILQVTAAVDVPKFHVNKKVNVTIKTNDPGFPDWVYHIEYEVIPRISIVPYTINMRTLSTPTSGGQPEQMATSAATVEVYGLPGEPLASDKLRPELFDAPEEFTLKMADKPTVDQPRNGISRASYPIVISPNKMTFSQGTYSSNIFAKLPDGSSTSAVLSWTIDSPIVASPKMIHFGVVSSNRTSSEQLFLLRSTKKKPFRILHLKVDSDHISAIKAASDETLEPKLTHQLKATYRFPSDGSDPRMSGFITITTDLQDMETIFLPWSVLLRQ